MSATLSRRRALGVGVAHPAFAIVAQRDRELLELGERLEAAWIDEHKAEMATDAELTALIDAGAAIVEKIEATRATTLAGLRAKARAYSWCCGGDEPAVDQISDQNTTADRLVISLLRDLFAHD